MKSNNKYWGLFFVVWGLLLLARNYDWLSEELIDLLFSFPMLIANVGIFLLLSGKNKVVGFSFLAVGILFLSFRFFDIEVNISKSILPFILIAIGIVGFFNKKKKKLNASGKIISDSQKNVKESKNKTFFSSNKVVLSSAETKKASFDVFFGSSSLDLRDFDFKVADFKLKAFCMFGELTILLPKEAKVDREGCSVVFGEIKFPNALPSGKTFKPFIIQGDVIFGAIKIIFIEKNT